MILLDTSFLIAYFDSRDVNNAKAVEILEKIESGEYGNVFISDYVFDETVTMLKKYLGTKLASEKGEHLLKSFDLLNTTNSIFEQTWTLFRKQEKLSFTDCRLVIQMQEHQIHYLATFDSGFGSIVNVVGK